jgi:hypothetical protein
MDAPERFLQRLEDVRAELSRRRDRGIRVVGKISNAVLARGLAVEKVAHEEISREPGPSQRFERLASFGRHGSAPRWNVIALAWLGRRRPEEWSTNYRPMVGCQENAVVLTNRQSVYT